MSTKASYWRRVVAYFIDGLLAGLVACVTIGLAIGATLADVPTAVGVLVIVASPVIITGFVLWNSVFRLGRTGQSIGKTAMNTQLVSTESGAPVGAGSAFARLLVEWALSAVTLGLFAVVDLLFPLFDKNGQRVVDKMLKMNVVKRGSVVSSSVTPQPGVTDSSTYG